MRPLLTALLVLLVSPAFATNYTVKAAGGGSFTTLAACATQMSSNGTGVSDTCTVFVGTYSENVTVPAGAASGCSGPCYKIFAVNGSDVVTVKQFTMGSHTKLIGNCPQPASTANQGACGFTITDPASQTHPCVTIGTSTDVYVTNNELYQCGSGLATVGNPSGNSGNWNCGSGALQGTDGATFIFVQGNGISYPSYNPTDTGGKIAVGMGILTGNGNSAVTSSTNWLIENNDFAHYDLGIKYAMQYGVVRNNTFHDQLESEGCENAHTDMTFTEQANNVKFNLIEGNFQRNGVGANAKGNLAQADNPCTGCQNLIIRYDMVSRIGSGHSSDYGTDGSFGDAGFPNIKQYNNTIVDANMEGASASQEIDHNSATLGAFLNNIYYFNNPSSWSNWNIYACGSSCASQTGFSSYWCVNTCTTPFGHIYGSGPWTSDTGNIHADPLFVNYVSAGSTSNNYHLQLGSPAIGAGTKLTTVAAGDSGSGTTLVLNDAAFFQDGAGMTSYSATVNVQPDCIKIGTGVPSGSNTACIAAWTGLTPNINYSTNTLTLTSSITRSSGDAVYLYKKSDGVQVLTGTAPDMGALPFTDPAPAPAPAFANLNQGKIKWQPSVQYLFLPELRLPAQRPPTKTALLIQ